MKDSGLLLVYTGGGKGKTTAAFGLGLRAWGHGRRVLVIQFMKGDDRYGEVRAARALPGFTVVQAGQSTFVKKGAPSPRDLELARRGMDVAWETLRSGEQDLLVLDELNVAVDYGLIPVDEVLRFARHRPRPMDLVITGRYADPALLAMADTVTEMAEVRHHYQAGVAAREGLEF